MKKKSFIFKNSTSLKTVIGIVLLFYTVFLQGQVQNDSALFVNDYGNIYFDSGNYYFGTTAITSTSRTNSIYGVISFGTSATYSGASNTSFVDGYVRVYGTNPFIFPIGQSNTLAPAAVFPFSDGWRDAAYFNESPTNIGATVDASVTAISEVEYWKINGSSSSNISLTWRNSSAIETLTASRLSDLIIVGWNGSNWEQIPSEVDVTSILGGVSNFSSGSITTSISIIPSVYSAYTFGSKRESCAPIVAFSGNTKIWDGTSWSPSAPTLADKAIINGSYNDNLSCNSLVLNANITLANGKLVEIVNGVTGGGKIVMSSEASVVQRNPVATAPTIELTKVTRPMRRYDYVFLSTPINNGATFYSNLTSNQNTAVNGNFGAQTNSAFSNFKTINAVGDQILVTTTVVGQGIRALVRNQAPFSTSSVAQSWNVEKLPISIKTLGIANNGDVAVTVPSNNWAFIGNPYPSAIDGFKLLEAAGSNVRKTLYYWTFNTPWTASTGLYSYNDWATWTTAGGVSTCSTCPAPDGSIASMQSVYIKAANATPTTFNLTNCMRQTIGNNTFFRITPKDRFWLNLSGSAGSFSQILLAYASDATLGEDQGFDGQRIATTNASVLSSLISTSKYAIQARPSFIDTDVVPLVVDKANNENFTISLGNKEGLFSSGSVTIYLHDILLGVYHNLTLSDYSFIQSADTDSSRFEVVYQDSTLGNPNFDVTTSVVVFIDNDVLHVQASQDILSVEIYDIAGRLIERNTNLTTKVFTKPFFHAQGVYVAKIKGSNGMVHTQKILNNK